MAQILHMKDSKITAVESQKFLEEVKLHDYLERHPELLPIHLVEDNPPPLVVIGREVAVPSGSVDLLLIDANARLTIIETKLARNPEARREVIGQVIEYASFITQWSGEQVSEQANSYLRAQRPEFDLFSVLRDKGAVDSTDESTFRLNIENYLKDGSVRLIIAVDELVESLRSIVTFLNQFSDFDILVLQLHDFPLADGQHVFIPSLFGYPPDSKTRGTKQWNEDSFIKDLNGRDHDSETVEATLAIYRWFCARTDWPVWGRGTNYGSFSLVLDGSNGRVNCASVTSNAGVYINFGWLLARNYDEASRQLAKSLSAIPGLGVREDAGVTGKYPGIPCRQLTNAVTRDKLLIALEEAVRAIKANA